MDANDCGTEEPNFSMEEAEVPRETVKLYVTSPSTVFEKR